MEKIIKTLNKNIFMNNNYNGELIDEIDKYWGKYSFLSLLSFEMVEKNKEYIDTNISKNIIEVIDKIWGMTVHVDKGISKIMSASLKKAKRLDNIQKGYIEKNQLNELNKYENVLIYFSPKPMQI